MSGRRSTAGLVRAAALVLAAMVAPAEAAACADHALIHDSVPVDPDERLIVARVDIDWAVPEQLYKAGIGARVVRMIRGRFDGELMILRTSLVGGCDNPFANGRSGLIVGIPMGMEGGALVVEVLPIPLRTSMPDGYRIPEAYLEEARRSHAGGPAPDQKR